MSYADGILQLFKPYAYVDEEYAALIEKYYDRFGTPIGAGLTRVTFQTRRGTVVKVPYNEDGVAANWRERNERDIPMPWRRMNSDGTLEMSKVRTYYIDSNFTPDGNFPVDEDDWPEWAWDIDSNQIGLYKGQLVAYDL
jgi:hypothetical protein